MRTDVLGVGFDALRMDEAVAEAMRLMAERRGAYVCTPNPEIVWACRKNPVLRAAVNEADLVLPDGVGVLAGASLVGEPLPERVSGIDFCCALLRELHGSVYLLGAKPGVAERAARAIESACPSARVCGVCDGYYEEEAAVVRAIRAAAPDLLLVCLGSPRQELFMAEHRLPEVGLTAGLGGTLDVLSGDVRRAPAPLIRLRLEWLYRLLRQPKRIKRALCLPLYLAAAAGQGLRKHGQRKTDRP